jgi:hypothetical protein
MHCGAALVLDVPLVGRVYDTVVRRDAIEPHDPNVVL